MNTNNLTPDVTPSIIYGIQRSSTNYIQELILKNFENIEFFNHKYSRCLPNHKHFRLYKEKYIISDPQYYNSFIYEDFGSFKKHVNQISGQKIKMFIVTIKNPFSWYLSYNSHAKKNRYPQNRKSFNSHFIVDYNLYYRYWLRFQNESPDEVLIVKYEDSLHDLSSFLDNIGAHFNLKRINQGISNPKKVGMSKKFSSKRANFYQQQLFMNQISDEDKHVILNLLDGEILKLYNYS